MKFDKKGLFREIFAFGVAAAVLVIIVLTVLKPDILLFLKALPYSDYEPGDIILEGVNVSDYSTDYGDNIEVIISFRENDKYGIDDVITYTWKIESDFIGHGWYVIDESGEENLADKSFVDGHYKMDENQRTNFFEGLKFIIGSAAQSTAIAYANADSIQATIIVREECRTLWKDIIFVKQTVNNTPFSGKDKDAINAALSEISLAYIGASQGNFEGFNFEITCNLPDVLVRFDFDYSGKSFDGLYRWEGIYDQENGRSWKLLEPIVSEDDEEAREDLMLSSLDEQLLDPSEYFLRGLIELLDNLVDVEARNIVITIDGEPVDLGICLKAGGKIDRGGPSCVVDKVNPAYLDASEEIEAFMKEFEAEQEGRVLYYVKKDISGADLLHLEDQYLEIYFFGSLLYYEPDKLPEEITGTSFFVVGDVIDSSRADLIELRDHKLVLEGGEVGPGQLEIPLDIWNHLHAIEGKDIFELKDNNPTYNF